jgi:hypothetical protein
VTSRDADAARHELLVQMSYRGERLIDLSSYRRIDGAYGNALVSLLSGGVIIALAFPSVRQLLLG